MDAATTARFNALLRGHHDDLVKRWTAAATSGLRGRLSEAELARQVREPYGVLLAATETAATDSFSPGETAVSVYALKEALAEVLDLDSGRGLRDFVAYSGRAPRW